VRARAEMNKMVNGLRALGGPWEGIQIVATAEQIGVRDGRRIKGRYTVVQDDLAKGARHDDAVVRVTFGIDVHALSAEHNKKHAIMPKPIDMKPYDIPLRALIAKDVDGLMMAGPLHQRRFHRALQLSRHRQCRGHGRGRRRHRRARRFVETPAARGHLERERGEAEGDGPAGVI
jgi:hypothetical protein